MRDETVFSGLDHPDGLRSRFPAWRDPCLSADSIGVDTVQLLPAAGRYS